uniref:RxLR effector candidate protein n=1 Tax=Hyaloperonospora arabidopsidis (strain Emoy2) TaxID=559515 RepID=M4B825_HYAAE|nr:RxLR effector candidate protein [Hyaloperonospora arabidopsidis Emoy2]
MIKRFLLFVLLLSPVAVGDALLALTASTLPDGTTSVQEQTTKSKTGVKQALKPSGGTTAAVGEERALMMFSGLEEGLSAGAGKLMDAFAWVAKKPAYWTNAEREGEAATELEAAWVKEDAKWERYKAAWRKKDEASGVTDTALRDHLKSLLKKDEGELFTARADWEKEVAAWGAKEVAWKKKEGNLVGEIRYTKFKIARQEIETYLPQFKRLKAAGVTREMYQNLLGLTPAFIGKHPLEGVTHENIFSNGPEYAKYLYFDRYLEYEGSSDDLLNWAYTLLRPNE